MRKLLSIIVLLLLVGCAIKTGRLFEYDKVKEVHLNQPQSEIRALFGEPFMVVHKSGHLCWIYNYSENQYNVLSISAPDQINLGVMFDDSNRVWSFEYNHNTANEKVQVGPYYEKGK